MFPLKSALFAAIDTQPLLTREVDIVNRYAGGAHPKPFTPPSYPDSTSPKSKRLSEYRFTLQNHLNGLARF